MKSSEILQSWWSVALIAGMIIAAFIGATVGKQIRKKHFASQHTSEESAMNENSVPFRIRFYNQVSCSRLFFIKCGFLS